MKLLKKRWVRILLICVLILFGGTSFFAIRMGDVVGSVVRDVSGTLEELEEVSSDLGPSIPTAYEVRKVLETFQTGYIMGAINDPHRVIGYYQKDRKAVNLGVYLADLYYTSLYQQRADTEMLIQASASLSNELDSRIFGRDMIHSFRADQINNDVLNNEITYRWKNAYENLSRHGIKRQADDLLVMAGCFLEYLHLWGQIVVDSEYAATGLAFFGEEKRNVHNIVELLEAHADRKEVNDVLISFRYIGLHFDAMLYDVPPTEAQFRDIYGSIMEMRNQLVEVEIMPEMITGEAVAGI